MGIEVAGEEGEGVVGVEVGVCVPVLVSDPFPFFGTMLLDPLPDFDRG